ncbi:MAG: hypothetical protein R3C05_25930 [Pirellulaceae bacterium]
MLKALFKKLGTDGMGSIWVFVFGRTVLASGDAGGSIEAGPLVVLVTRWLAIVTPSLDLRWTYRIVVLMSLSPTA